MGRRTSYPPGTFCNVDLVTPDQEGSKAFYAGLLGWDAEDLPHGYTAFRSDGAIVAGAITLSAEQQTAGAPPAWTTYVRVEDVEATAARVQELGGSLLGEVFVIPQAGRGVAFADPQGAVLLAWEAEGFEGAELVNAPGAWSWGDLQTPDPEAALSFYAELFDWAIEAVEGSHGMYWSVASGGRRIGGIMRAAQAPRPFWAVYFGVDDVDAALERVAAGGGSTLVEPMSVPAGRFAVALDPQGAAVCFVEGEFDD